ncbi:hypothetical protein [Streptomyces sp. I05A-00742]|nr:hypothetical protein [Streptomyces sp. I05A-00742]
MAHHRRLRSSIGWDRVKRGAKAVTPWVELIVAVTTLILIVIGKG